LITDGILDELELVMYRNFVEIPPGPPALPKQGARNAVSFKNNTLKFSLFPSPTLAELRSFF